MTESYVQELNKHHVYVQDEERVNKLIDDIVVGGKDNLQIIFDFDNTLTKLNDCTNTHVSSFELLNYCPSVTKEYLEALGEMMNSSGWIEFSSTIPSEKKSEMLTEVWSEVSKVVTGLAISYEEISKAAAKDGPSLRVGAEQFLADLNEANIPVLVFSAGYGDSVKAVLEHFNVLYPNIKIVSNFFRFDKGVIQGFKNSVMINTRNKNDLASVDPEYIDSVKNRSNVVLVGDSLGDACMADGIPNTKHILKIGLKCKLTDETVSDFLKVFDIVVEDATTMNVILDIFKHILKQ